MLRTDQLYMCGTVNGGLKRARTGFDQEPLTKVDNGARTWTVEKLDGACEKLNHGKAIETRS